MGSGASSREQPLSEVAIKNEIGVLYDAEKKNAFDAAATEGPDGTRVVAWPAIEAYAHDNDERALDPRKCLYINLKAFKSAREQIADIARVHIKGAVREIPWVGKSLGDDCRQCGLDGEPAASLDALYEVAKLARVHFEQIMTAACPGSGVKLMFAPLKGRDRAGAKARDEYADKTAPCYSWLFDITRGAALCQTEDAIVQLYASLEADDRVDIVRTKNRFAPPLFNGYQDILMNVAVKVENVKHLCELQIHLMPIKESEALHQSHTVYEYFRSFFLGNSDAVKKRLEMLCKLPVDQAEDVGELVDHVLRDFEDEAPYRANARYWGDDDRELAFASDDKLLEGLCELLESIQESSGVVRVREAILAEKERAFGAKSRKVGSVLWALGEAYSDLGDYAKFRDVLERALPIYEREHGKDSTLVAAMLMNLGVAYGNLGDHAKKRDVLERSLVIKERAYGRDHTLVANALTNLGGAHISLGDYSKACDMLERALAIKEREYGRDHAEVAATLTNLGSSYGRLGDHAKKRDMLERALAIKERAYGRDHAEVSTTLTNLGGAYIPLGDYSKACDMLERALAIDERTYGPDHPDVAITLFNLAMAHGKLGEDSKKCELLERTLAIFEGAYGSDHPHTEMCQRNLNNARADVEYPLRAAARRGDVKEMTQLLDDGAAADQGNQDGATPLYAACEEGHVDAAKLLVHRGADVHRVDSNNCTLLLVACAYGHIEIAKLLLDSGAVSDLDRADNDGDTPMSCATQGGHTAIVDLLSQYNAP
jgi:tetratricopeptide (TPR) repeat protein